QSACNDLHIVCHCYSSSRFSVVNRQDLSHKLANLQKFSAYGNEIGADCKIFGTKSVALYLEAL
ncbi:MAG: hypothetical protein KA796_12505, partial [Chryseobacterium sp.]|nr:hypothetical protein [Chryseobacterium sp.]